MAHAQDVPPEALAVIARQIGERTPSIPPGAAAQPGREVAESFPIWRLGLNATAQSTRDLRSLAVHTGSWHHQIRTHGSARAVARSTPNGPHPEDWQLLDVSASPLAPKVDDAIEWIDANVTGDPLVRMLIIPSYYIVAFWLQEGNADDVVMIDFPERFARLQYHHSYSSQDFLEELSKEQHAQGIPHVPPSP